jgi:hypothetical protein
MTVITMPGCLHGFLHAMPPLVAALQRDSHYNWGRQVTFQSFWRLLIQGNSGGATWPIVRALAWVCSAGFALALLASALRWIRAKESNPSPDRLIAAVIVAAPLIMPYYMDYDLILLVIPAVLQARSWLDEPGSRSRADHVRLWAWVALFLATYVNPGFAREFHVNLTVLALISFGLPDLLHHLDRHLSHVH